MHSKINVPNYRNKINLRGNNSENALASFKKKEATENSQDYSEDSFQSPFLNTS